MTDQALAYALGADHAADVLAELDDLRAEVKAYRDGVGQLAYDPPTPGRPVEAIYRNDDEPTFHQQVTAGGLPVWVCAGCVKLTVGIAPKRCAGCLEPAEEMLSEVLSEPLECRSWNDAYGGPCLIAGSDGCDCPVQNGDSND